MASPRLIKCKGECGNKYPKSDLIELNKKHYCKDCLSKMEESNQYKNTLYDCIKEIFQIDRPTALHFTQIKKTLAEGYNYKDIYNGLRYAYEVLQIKFYPNTGLGYAINNINEGNLYYKNLEEKNNINLELWNENLLKEKEVSIPSLNTLNEYKKDRLIKWEDILNGR